MSKKAESNILYVELDASLFSQAFSVSTCGAHLRESIVHLAVLRAAGGEMYDFRANGTPIVVLDGSLPTPPQEIDYTITVADHLTSKQLCQLGCFDVVTTKESCVVPECTQDAILFTQNVPDESMNLCLHHARYFANFVISQFIEGELDLKIETVE